MKPTATQPQAKAGFSLSSFLKEYPLLKDLAISLLAGGSLAMVGGAAKRRGHNVSPALLGLLGAATPFALGALSNTGVVKNVNRYGTAGLFTPTSQLKHRPNRPGYVRKYLRSLQGAGTLPDGYKIPTSLEYGRLDPINHFQNQARHPLIQDMDNRIADKKWRDTMGITA